ncbi:conserved exported hypothetical protein, DUF323 [Nitrospina gracilis 3/211]|uniref:Sulfatase-modifying factor enzyme-like domain-containing protein n=1 Tax=Nitrospina gracilis (strain 3/211) TaxID=1266370 RepID=M1ZC55_NITG3|nr:MULTISPECIES: formylglycine-generating enzyme family protein [Nitrospina]MCF8723761.1 formylglycine-generating enzyme required for sulfatase activity [Nitrospina sp. Nb-3]CCQ90868.1 conserved exported hypothetical protein, DUF323 [Nitrospina gracilis 3/211]
MFPPSVKPDCSFLLKLCVVVSMLYAPSSAFAESSSPENMVLINASGFVRGMDADKARLLKEGSGSTALTPMSEEAFRDEGPARMIYLDSYYIDKFEVSNAQYTEFIMATDYPAPAYWDHHELNKPDYPVTGVNWFDANAYCHWANKRLPTEAEWEKAARGPAGFLYPWGNGLDYSKANFARGKRGETYITQPVDSHPEGKSYYGVYNMAGNVFEWVQDWYDPNYYKTSKDVRNPKGPDLDPIPGTAGNLPPGQAGGNGKKKVIRGGSWFAPAQSVTTTHRFWNDPMNNSYGVGLGFRCARDFEEQPAMESRMHYMDALIHMGAEKFERAREAIQKALQLEPENKEYRNLQKMIANRL